MLSWIRIACLNLHIWRFSSVLAGPYQMGDVPLENIIFMICRYINIVFLNLFWTYLTTLSVLAGPDQMGGVPLENRRKKKIPAVLNKTESPHLQLLGCATISLDINQLNTNDLKAFLLCMYVYLLLFVRFIKLNRITSNQMAKIYHK